MLIEDIKRRTKLFKPSGLLISITNDSNRTNFVNLERWFDIYSNTGMMFFEAKDERPKVLDYIQEDFRYKEYFINTEIRNKYPNANIEEIELGIKLTTKVPEGFTAHMNSNKNLIIRKPRQLW